MKTNTLRLAPEPNFSLEEFQIYAETHSGLWELYDGYPVRMAAPGNAHQWISGEIMFAFKNYFRDKQCIPLQERDVWAITEPPAVPKTERRHAVRKPDLLVFCDKSQLQNGVVLRPQLVVEIWSPSNTTEERMEKQQIYTRIGVQEIWTVDIARRDFAILTSTRGEDFISGGTFADSMESRLFKGLSVTLDGFQNFVSQIGEENL